MSDTLEGPSPLARSTRLAARRWPRSWWKDSRIPRPESALTLTLALLTMAEVSLGAPWQSMVVGLAFCIAAFTASTYPTAGGIVTGVCLTACCLLPSSWVGIAIHACLIPLYVAAERGLVWLGRILSVWFGAALIGYSLKHLGLSLSASYLTVWALLIGAAWYAGDHALRTRQARAELRRQALQEQRLALARELHDTIAQSITAILMRGEELRQLGAYEASDLDFFVNGARRASRDLRAILTLLRHEGSPVPTNRLSLEGIISSSVRDLRDEGFTVTHQRLGDLGALPDRVSMTLAELLREAVSNVLRHGDRKGEVTLLLEADEETAELLVVNTALAQSATDASGSHYGLTGMRERVEALGGLLQAQPAGHHWMTRVVLPTALSAATSEEGTHG